MSILFIAVICIWTTLIYMSIGLGVSKMVSKVNNTPTINFGHVITWPLSCIVYAFTDEAV